MRELEKLIVEWREEMKRAGGVQTEALDELETHLREQTAALIRSGMNEEAAFQKAVSQLGSAGSIRREFNKLNGTPASAAIVWAGWTTLLVAFIGALIAPLDGISNPLFMSHEFCLSAGYVVIFVSGGKGIFYVFEQLVRHPNPAREKLLCRSLFSFQCLAAELVGAGLLLGMIWTKQTSEEYFNADLREIGTFCVGLWLVAILTVQRRSRLSRHAILLLPIVGNMILIAAWFGTGIATSKLKSYGFENVWPYEFLMALHVLVFLIGLLPLNSARAKTFLNI